MNYVWAGASDVGRVRTQNEDSFYPTFDGAGDGPLLVAVADGMGGHAAGEIASRIAIDTVGHPVKEDADPHTMVQAANDAVLEAVGNDPTLAGMGTTLSMALLEPGGTARVGHVGDSRIYLLRGGKLRRVTVDHTVVAEMVAMGQIRPDEEAQHPQRHLLTRALGMRDVGIFATEEALESGDRLLLCSDGLTEMVTEPQIVALITGNSPSEAVWRLVEAANAAGGVDNTTALVVDAAE